MNISYFGTIARRAKRPPFYLESLFRLDRRFLRIKRSVVDPNPIDPAPPPPSIAQALAGKTGGVPLDEKSPGIIRTPKKKKPVFRSPFDQSPARIPKQGTALHWAVDPWKEDEARLILEKRLIDINARDEDGQTALHLAAAQDEPEAAQLLIDFGADINAADGQGFTPLHRAVWSKKKEALQVLLDSGANIEADDIHGETPLYTATRRNVVVMVQILLAAGAKLGPPKGVDTTLIHHATRLKRKRILEIFLNLFQTSDVDAVEPGGITPLHLAAIHDQYIVAHMLLEKGANPDAQDSTGRTPLHLAAECEAFKTVAVLRQMGANAEIMNNDGCVPDEEVVQLHENRTIKNLDGLVKPADLIIRRRAMTEREMRGLERHEMRILKYKPQVGKGEDWDVKLDRIKERQREKRRYYVQLHLSEKAEKKDDKKKNRWAVRGQVRTRALLEPATPTDSS